MIKKLTDTLTKKMLTPERIAPVVESLLKSIIGKGDNEKVFRIQQATEGGASGYKASGIVTVRTFSAVDPTAAPIVDTLEMFLKNTFSGFSIPGLPIGNLVEEKTRQICDACLDIFRDPDFYVLIGMAEPQDGGSPQITIQTVQVTYQDNPTSNAPIEIHTPLDEIQIMDVLPDWIARSGAIPQIEAAKESVPGNNE